jgi:flagellar basal-body rod protein FlgG
VADGIYTALSGGMSNLEILDLLANNLSNADTVGFKEDRPLFAEVLRRRLPGAIGDNAQVETRGVAIDLRQGPLQRTGNPLDLALAGDGFFAVKTARGVRYTRRGDFRIGAGGTLLTTTGTPVLGEGGPIRLPGGEIAVDERGNIFSGNSLVGRLRIVQLPPASLSKEGDGLFASRGPELPSSARVVQGHLERSNVSPVEAMSQMILATRSFEIALQAIQSYRRMDERLVAEAGRSG